VSLFDGRARRHASVIVVCLGAAAILLIAPQRVAHAGNIPGLPMPLPPARDDRLRFGIENDFLGRGGEFDDNRTDAFALDLSLGERWLVVVDHSILTHEGPTPGAPEPGEEGRLDEWAVSLAHRWDAPVGRVTVGAGLRGVGELNGAQIQNGFHRMFGSRIVDLPYLPSHRTDADAWLTLDREALCAMSRDWKGGWWLNGAGQARTSGKLDGSLGAFGLVQHEIVQVRLGLRAEHREAADNIVQTPTADNERGVFGVLGVGVGPLDVETYQRTDGQAAYGRVILRAGPPTEAAETEPGDRYELRSGLRFPETALRIGAAWSPPHTSAGARHPVVVLDFLTGQTPQDDSVERFRVERQLTGGVEWRGPTRAEWITPLAGVGFGWRSESIEGAGALADTRSETAERAVVTGEAGADTRMSDLGGNGRLSLRLSLTGHWPLGDATVSFAGQSYRIERPDAGLAVTLVAAAGR
jgi:hypothetical protein